MSGMGGGAGRRIHAIEGSPFGPYPLSQTIQEPVMRHINFHVLCLATFIVAAIAFGFAVPHAGTADAVQAQSGPSLLLTPFSAMPRVIGPGTKGSCAACDTPPPPAGVDAGHAPDWQVESGRAGGGGRGGEK